MEKKSLDMSNKTQYKSSSAYIQEEAILGPLVYSDPSTGSYSSSQRDFYKTKMCPYFQQVQSKFFLPNKY